MEPLDRLIQGIKKETECSHYDYGKSADKALGAYCTKFKKMVKEDGCDECLKPLEDTFLDMFGVKVKMSCMHRIVK